MSDSVTIPLALLPWGEILVIVIGIFIILRIYFLTPILFTFKIFGIKFELYQMHTISFDLLTL